MREPCRRQSRYRPPQKDAEKKEAEQGPLEAGEYVVQRWMDVVTFIANRVRDKRYRRNWRSPARGARPSAGFDRPGIHVNWETSQHARVSIHP